MITIVPFSKEYSKAFYDLNIEWLKTFFYVEPYDEDVLSQPEKYIINKGGYIFFSKLEETIVGTYALMPLKVKDGDGFELTKMAVCQNYRGQKIGQHLLEHCIAFSKKQRFKRLLLYSSTKLENAIYLYRKYGFAEMELEANSPYKRSNIKMEYTLK